MSVVKKGPARTIRGIRTSIPAGYVLGRLSSGEGDVQLIHLSELGGALTSPSNGGGGGGGGVASAGSVQQVQAQVAGANSTVQTLVQQITVIQSSVAAAGMFADSTPFEPDWPISDSLAFSSGAGVTALSALTDVNLTSLTDDDILVYNAASKTWVNRGLPIYIQKDCGDETTAITAATGKKTFRIPHTMALSEVRASLTTAQATNGAGGIFTVDVKQNGVSIFSTLLTIDNTEKTSKTATISAALSATTLYDDDEMRIDVTQIGDGTAAGLKVTLIGTRSNAASGAGAYFGPSYFAIGYFGVYA